ncbi:MAG TPA: transcription repressor NadR [Firmicutes bacterium]|nr:transcription repressor NadR [Bacillota bacterium]
MTSEGRRDAEDRKGGEVRRGEIIALLRREGGPVTGSELASRLGVSRQVVVQDIALLRAGGEKVLSTPRGYVLADSIVKGLATRTIPCRHDQEGLVEELHTIVGLGGRIVDVIVEHPIYGELKGMLMIETHQDVDEFYKALVASEAKPLSALTEGLHLHTVQAASHAALDAIEQALDKKGYLVRG